LLCRNFDIIADSGPISKDEAKVVSVSVVGVKALAALGML
jgi:hypothetical protein